MVVISFFQRANTEEKNKVLMRKIKELNSQIEAGKGLAQEIAQKDKVLTNLLTSKEGRIRTSRMWFEPDLEGYSPGLF